LKLSSGNNSERSVFALLLDVEEAGVVHNLTLQQFVTSVIFRRNKVRLTLETHSTKQ